jgi:hypothetical protein
LLLRVLDHGYVSVRISGLVGSDRPLIGSQGRDTYVDSSSDRVPQHAGIWLLGHLYSLLLCTRTLEDVLQPCCLLWCIVSTMVSGLISEQVRRLAHVERAFSLDYSTTILLQYQDSQGTSEPVTPALCLAAFLLEFFFHRSLGRLSGLQRALLRIQNMYADAASQRLSLGVGSCRQPVAVKLLFCSVTS